ncbi:hypothetical protein DV515_00000461 [Chloebia gouldiae]|uniref:Uncharacterized protein n=1 Tax=Chloebia gouldiae TaxID=44316 RepID=A0A3L8SZW4_CHLGU|nr:hypothetical protein DV515_00000461 [Chloebia gouldiae]
MEILQACSELGLAALSRAPAPTPFAINHKFQDLASEISRLHPSRPSYSPSLLQSCPLPIKQLFLPEKDYRPE